MRREIKSERLLTNTRASCFLCLVRTGPCRKFTPELTSFYDKMNNRRGKKDEFEIIWVSRCRDMESFGQYFTQMGSWFALPPEEAMGARGQMLAEKLKVKGIPHLALLDDLGNGKRRGNIVVLFASFVAIASMIRCYSGPCFQLQQRSFCSALFYLLFLLSHTNLSFQWTIDNLVSYHA
jgi:nucleoredoxin